MDGLPTNKEIQKLQMIFNILHTAIAFIIFLPKQNAPAVNQIFSYLQPQNQSVQYVIIWKQVKTFTGETTYCPTQGR
jgi:hypothetical protein